MQPSFCQGPITVHRRRGDAQDISGAFDGEASEEAQFHDTALLRVDPRETLESIVYGYQVHIPAPREGDRLIEHQQRLAAAPLKRIAFAGVANQNAANDLSCDSEKMVAVLETDSALIDQLEVRFVHQGRALQCVVWPLSPKLVCGQLAQLCVDQGSQLIQGRLVSIAPFQEQRRDVLRLGTLHWSHPWAYCTKNYVG
jgi:hypothetical protein